MNLLNVLILAVVQGLTEFLPVSSSGHLVLIKKLLSVEWGMGLDIWLHLASLFAILVFFRRSLAELFSIQRLKKPHADYPGWLRFIFISSCITIACAYFARDYVAQLFTEPRQALICLFVTGALLLSTRQLKPTRKTLTLRDAVIFGLVQALAILPGISRSGITIVALLFLRVRYPIAFLYTFLASLPVIVAAFVYEWQKGGFTMLPPHYLGLSFGLTFVTGLFALSILKRVVMEGKLHFFGYYLLGIAALGLFLIK